MPAKFQLQPLYLVPPVREEKTSPFSFGGLTSIVGLAVIAAFAVALAAYFLAS
jgi:hypothetical protein